MSTNGIRSTTFGDVLTEHRRGYPDRVAVVDGDTRITWSQLDDRVTQLANALAGLGVEAGDRVAWLGQTSHRIWETMLAVARLGAILCPSNWRGSPEELAFVVDDLTPKVVFWQAEEVGDNAIKSQELVKADARWVQVDTDDDGFESLLAAGSHDVVDRDVDPDAAVLVIYTAAFGGTPNGSMLSQTGLFAMAYQMGYFHDIDDKFVYLNTGAMFHIANWMYLVPTFVFGGVNVFLRRVDPEAICRLVQEERCTNLFVLPPTIANLVEIARGKSFDLSSLRVSQYIELWEGVAQVGTSRSARVVGGYGQTEVTGTVLLGAMGPKGTGNAGRAVPFAQVRIEAPDGTEARHTEVGEITVRGPLVNVGFWNRPKLNQERFRGGWWHTTDLGRREVDGTVTFVGTKSRMIKSAAENIYPVDVETCIESHPEVREAAVIGVPDRTYFQSVKAIVVLNEGATTTPEEIIAHCAARIASYKKPKFVELAIELPKNGPAKDYDELDRLYGGGNYPGGETLLGVKPKA